MKQAALVLTLSALMPGVALAHPGPHGGDLFANALHLLAESSHLGLTMMLALAGIAALCFVPPNRPVMQDVDRDPR